MTTDIGICPYCHQTVMMADTRLTGQELIAEMYCTCEKAVQHQRLTRAYAAVEKICVEMAKGAGFAVLGEDCVEQVKSACESLVTGCVDATDFKFDGGDKISLTMKDGDIFVKRTRRLELTVRG